MSASDHCEPGGQSLPILMAPEMRNLLHRADLFAASSLTILILGETGVGKELIAERVHRRSPRRCGNMLKVNCASLAESLVESELFGHERGAFTGALAQREGLFEAADGGTLFLDEVGELSPVVQAKLLRVLECGEIVRVGATKPVRVDVRIVAATHRDLAQLVRIGRFREDLYFRLTGAELHVPPLRKRQLDIEPLAIHFADRMARSLGRPVPQISSKAIHILLLHPWPGNVRELKLVIERAVVVCQGDTLGAECLEFPRRDVRVEETKDGHDEFDERSRIIKALQKTNGNQTRAAELLGMTRRSLVNKLDRYEIARPRKRALDERSATRIAGGGVLVDASLTRGVARNEST
ncbi:sigma 54-interacting transcriptional regulator [Pendulispora brunnea]|uniref:Sigma 54-interacting transcriptional regulator n=1 Tax=Pendulispora brunnea TaxID=2905690 RepID=A0ABZ2KKF3_9BACT